MKKLQGKSFNIVQQNISKLKELFPEVFAEDKIDFEKLQLVLGENIELSNERYSFNWKGKSDAIKLAQKQSTGTLRPCKEESVNWDTTKNLYIEGDNLEVLRLLQNSYRNKVKMIYIDPPYNTGNDFVYKDDFRDNISNYKERMNESFKSNAETNGRYHTDWLNMMYPRLQIARNLLKEDGIIFISIDDNEITNLKKICDEIFGEINFIGCIANINNPKGRSDDKYFATAHEYLLVYKKQDAVIYGFEPEEKVLKRYNKTDEFNKKYRHIDLRKTGDSDRREDRPNMFYYFMYNQNTGDFYPTFDNDELDGYIKIYPTRDDGSDGRWRLGIDTAKERINQLLPNYMKVKNKWTVVEKDYLSDNAKVKPTTNWNFKDVNSERGTERFVDLGFDKTVFPRPKPIGTVYRITEISSNGNDIILDFFSGSSTTAHAVMKLNAEDSGKRRFIMVQIPEQTPENSEARKAGYQTISQIGKERIRRAGKKILEENKDKEGIENLDIGFKVFKLDYTNFKIWGANEENLKADLIDMVNPIKEDRSQEDVVYEILLKYGVDLTMPIEEIKINGYKIFSVGKGYLLICLENDLSLELIQSLSERKPKRIVFYDKGFKTETVRINGEQILKKFGVKDIRVI